MNIDKLKNKILQLAIQGKLVGQDENDESAEILNKKIQEEKEKLIKEKKIRKDNLAKTDINHISFQLPCNWSLIKMGDIAQYRRGPFGSSITKSIFVEKGNNTAKIYEQGNAIRKDINYGNYYITESKFKELEAFKVSPGDILISCAGTIGETYILPEIIEKGIINQALIRVEVSKFIEKRYFLMYFDYILESDIQSASKGSAIKNIPPMRILKNITMPLPPLNEQKRILKKIDELFEIIDQFNDEKEDILELIKNTRGSILAKAIEGKLVEQHENDESAKMLYQKIQEEKEKLIKEKNIKWSTVDAIEKNEAYYKIPKNWIWTKFGDICNIRRGASPRPIKKYITEEADGVNWIKIGDGNEGKYLKSTNQKITVKGANKSVYLEKGSLILSNSMSFGKPYILDIDGCIHDGWLSVQFNKVLIEKELLYYFLLASFAELEKKAYGTGVKNLNTDRVKNLLIPLPPLNEQKRVVEKINKIMNYLDEIESIIND